MFIIYRENLKGVLKMLVRDCVEKMNTTPVSPTDTLNTDHFCDPERWRGGVLPTRKQARNSARCPLIQLGSDTVFLEVVSDATG